MYKRAQTYEEYTVKLNLHEEPPSEFFIQWGHPKHPEAQSEYFLDNISLIIHACNTRMHVHAHVILHVCAWLCLCMHVQERQDHCWCWAQLMLTSLYVATWPSMIAPVPTLTPSEVSVRGTCAPFVATWPPRIPNLLRKCTSIQLYVRTMGSILKLFNKNRTSADDKIFPFCLESCTVKPV